MKQYLPTIIVGILSAGGMTAVVQVALLRRNSEKLRAEAEKLRAEEESIMTGTAERVVAMVRGELDKTTVRADRAESIAAEALYIVRQLVNILLRHEDLNDTERTTVVEMDDRARTLERRRMAFRGRDRRASGQG